VGVYLAGIQMQKLLLLLSIVIAIACIGFLVYSQVYENKFHDINPNAEEILQDNPSSDTKTEVRFDQKIPDVLIIGVRKGGTSALLHILRYHPQIEGAPHEVCYFSHNDYYRRGISWYIKQMPQTTKGHLTLEKCPNYFVSPKAPERIAEQASKNVKLILLVRNPLSRTISDYFFQKEKKTGNQHNEFATKVLPNGEIDTDCIEIRHSIYDVHYACNTNHF